MSQLQISIGQFSDKGRKQVNQDFHGVYIPEESQLTSKGIAIGLADGISSSVVSQVASEATIASFLNDYFCTSETWSVKKSVQRVLIATNSWLHSQTRRSEFRYDKDKGYVCTLSAMVIKSRTAHIFHVGDSRIYRLRGVQLEQLTTDHRMWISEDQSYLSRGMGINAQLEIEHESRSVEEGDIFFLATDGVYEFVSEKVIIDVIRTHEGDLEQAAKTLVKIAYDNDSGDNLTAQIVKVDSLPSRNADETYQRLTELPFPPELEARMEFDGYTILRKIHASSRSHVYLATDTETGAKVVLKTPSIDLRGDAAYLDRFLMEEWVARRITSPYVLKPNLQTRKRNFLYVAMEFIEGQTLTQWMTDNPKPDVEAVRGIVEQVAKGLRAFHRLEMVHQDLRPENIMIDTSGTVKIIDFGATLVAGLSEISSPISHSHIQGTAQYTAPEFFLGESGTSRSDIFSLGVITYQMLTGRLPYGAEVAKTKTRAAQRNLHYQSALKEDLEIPAWIDETLMRSVHPDPFKRYGQLSEFLYGLRHPSKEFLSKTRPPLMVRDPVVFWKFVSLILAGIIAVLLSRG